MKNKNKIKEISQIYETIFNNAKDGILVAGIENKKFHMSNKMICQMLGYSPEEIRNIGVMDIHPEKDLPYIIEQFEKQSRKELGIAEDIPVKRKEGSVFYADINSFPITLYGKPYLVGIFRDTTERKQVGEALRESEIKNRTLIENLPQKIFMKDRNSVYISCNKNYARDLKIRPEEIVGKTDYDFYPKELAEKYRADDKKIMDSGKIEEIEERYIQHGEERFVYTTKTSVKDEQGNVTGILGIFWDITERKRVEEEVRERKKELELKTQNLEEANIALKVLLKRRDEDKTELEEKILLNVKELVAPYLDKLKMTGLDEKQKTYVSILESNLNDIISPFSHKLYSMFLDFTPTEIQVVNLIRQGKTSKEIGELFHCTPSAIAFHRNNIRKKLRLKNKKTNLKSYLLSKQQ